MRLSARFSRMGNNSSNVAVVNNRRSAARASLQTKKQHSGAQPRRVAAYSASDSYGFDPTSLEEFNPATGTYGPPPGAPGANQGPASPAMPDQASVAVTLEREMAAMEPAVLADTLWAYTLSRDYDPGVYAAVVQVVSDRMDDYDATSLVDVLCALAEAGHENDLFYTTCTAYLSGKLRNLPTSALSNLVWCVAFLHLEEQRDLLQAAARAALPKIKDFNPADLAKFVAGLAQALPLSPAEVTPAEPYTVMQALQPAPEEGDTLDEQRAYEAAKQVREAMAIEEEAASKPAYGFERFLSAASERFLSWLPLMQLSAESLSQVVWSYMSLDMYKRALFDGVRASLMQGKASELAPLALSNVVWAYATARTSDTQHRSVFDVNLMEDLFNSARLHMDSRNIEEDPSYGFASSSLVTMAVALSRAPHYDASFYSDIARSLLPRVPALGEENPVSLVMAMWAFARMSHRSSPKCMHALCEEAAKYMSMYDSEDMIHLASAMATTGVYHDNLMRTVTGTATSAPDKFDSTQLLDLVRIIAAVQHHEPEYYEDAQTSILAHVNEKYRNTNIDALDDHCGAQGGN